ncbi:MAG: Cell division protein DivIC (FtsB), stabilizes FtsL against RasP cleavage, partial [uncultured Ramlibacter sp.]
DSALGHPHHPGPARGAADGGPCAALVRPRQCRQRGRHAAQAAGPAGRQWAVAAGQRAARGRSAGLEGRAGDGRGEGPHRARHGQAQRDLRQRRAAEV